MMKNRIIGAIASLGVSALSALAGTATWNFNSDPATGTTPLTLLGAGNGGGDWVPSDGAAGGANDGYLSISGPTGSQWAKVIFPDVDNGKVITAFTFECKLRIGNGSATPADGFSINYARATDPTFIKNADGNYQAGGWSGTVSEPGSTGGSMAGLAEEGTITGLAIGFDAYNSGSALWPSDLNSGISDLIGISVRVDNKCVAQVAMSTLNGACDDNASLQTGPRNESDSTDLSVLCWQPLKVQLTEDRHLSVWWKGRAVVDNLPVDFAPSAGRLVFGGRTGGSFQNQHIDDIVLTTVSTEKALLSTVTADTSSIMVTLSDSGDSVVNTNSVTVTVDGTAVTPQSITKAEATTTIKWESSSLYTSGQKLAISVAFKDTRDVPISGTRTVTVPTYATLSEDLWTAPGTGDTSKPGMKARVWQVDQPGSNSLANRTHRAEQELAGIIGPNVADLTGATAGVFNIDRVNWNQEYAGTEIGDFQTSSTPSRPDAAIPGIPGTGSNPNDSIAAEVITYLEFPASGLYTMGAYSDDGFNVTVADIPPVNNLALVVTGAASAAGSYAALSGPATTSKPFTAPVSGKLVYMDAADGCTVPVNAEALRGNIALVDRGTCNFSAKIKFAKEAGALACVVVNNRALDNAEGVFPTSMGVGDVGYQDLPAVMISMPDGDKIKAGLTSGLTVSLTPDTTPSVGGADGDSPGGEILFNFYVPQAGVYPFRLVWYEGNGGANLEWFTVTRSGAKILINDRDNAAALKGYRARTATPQPKPTISLTGQGGNVKITFTGTLQAADELSGQWTDLNAASPYTVNAGGAKKFSRAKR